MHTLAEIRSEDELNQLFPQAIFPLRPEGGDTLAGSMEQLKKGLESGTVLIQFEVSDSESQASACPHQPALRCLGQTRPSSVALTDVCVTDPCCCKEPLEDLYSLQCNRQPSRWPLLWPRASTQ